ncbi:bifunctional 2-C-methyl-D-erythritol 4-phosphate cytidylyltransferase/2-C-methyl-D-erythritol 2,4-cyclodiphosphate synthase [Albimonas pacifica]|uniref:Bifunctional enzyme IspD/IspF n=1 Tax=Albimonas pacifica TaxID=1114924 RepID=A0A1I3K7I9_9RHOB|nr:bifunctional 2-C-methyl-D-erythritol 4-phosphate cytidylyltransferase/2-C-methyl-D-erythritol 2,4-cyclodiphosphate synthase [Albimonas pacifica]SFI68482.1 2-C-methyl-D-erythritol 2,4-cyclodiphosphate synthase [Albimonas pacifica]
MSDPTPTLDGDRAGPGPVHVLVVAAGRGTRAGPGAPKQYRALGGEAVLRRTLAAVAAWPGASAARTRVVIHPEDAQAYAEATRGLGLAAPVSGGATRQESVRLGLEAIRAGTSGACAVLIHDAARPFAEPALAGRVLDALARGSQGACPALPVVDTLRRGALGGPAGAGVERAGLLRAQTPQGFALDAILAAHRAAAGREMTDDVAVAQAAGLEVEMVEGDEVNLKLTTPADFARAETWLQAAAPEVRVGTGFDVHAFAPGTSLWLCGVEIPFDRTLSGHSDADVGMHALTDAIFGALAEGDIGRWFPPSDPQWKGAPSEIFLRKAMERVAARGGRLLNADITLICEAPKIGPHSDPMRARLAEIMDVHLERVSVKATTTERLGFPGRGEGIAAQAAASIALPGPCR